MLSIKERSVATCRTHSNDFRVGAGIGRKMAWAIVLSATIQASFGAAIFGTLFLIAGISKASRLTICLVSWAVIFAITWRTDTDKWASENDDSCEHSGKEWVIEISEISTVTLADDLEDFGPGYFLSTRDQEIVFVCGQILGDHDSKGTSLTQELIITVSWNMEIVGVQCKGDKVAIAPESVSAPIQEVTGILIIKATDLSIFPEAMRSVVRRS